MDNAAVTKPCPTPQPDSHKLSFDDNSEKQFDLQFKRPPSEFDPCANAKITSPFYLYNHESPRPSTDSKPRPNIHVTVKDLEAQTPDLTPTVTREKRGSSDSGKIKLWSKRRPSRCMTKKKESRWKSLQPWQRLMIKLVIGLLLTGMIVGVAVGVSMRVHGGVYKNNNQSTNIG